MAAARTALVIIGALLAWNAAKFIAMALRAITYPYELDYGEGIVWYQVRQLFAGEAFGDINQFPAVVFHYTPFYHALSGLLAAIGIDGLAAGRIISSLSTAIIAGLVGCIVYRFVARDGVPPRLAVATAAVAAMLLALCYPILLWAPLMRVDMLAFALTLAGVYAGLRAISSHRSIYVAAIFFVLAVYTKQTMVAAPAALFLMLLAHRPRVALAGIATCLLVGSTALALLAWATDGGFLRHIFLYNVNRFDPERLEWIAIMGIGHVLLIAAALVGLATYLPALGRFFVQRRHASPDDVEASFLASYLVLTTIMLLLVSKSGSSANYFIEWMIVLCIYAGVAVSFSIRKAFGHDPGSHKVIFGSVLVPIALAAQLLVLPPTSYRADIMSKRGESLAKLVERVKSAERPVISDDMVILQRAGQPILWEPAIFAELGAKGVWDERPFVKMVEQRRFGFFVTAADRGEKQFNERYNPAVAEAMRLAYPKLEKLGGLTLHLPDDSGVSGRAAPGDAAGAR